ncbi:hypothetical protein, partial [Pseudonocardia halophobica]|uniref:hypothetical protein n=1 Tax=Pseudonocardia halophobica TaxID=29401 RepID=UPI0022F2FB9B
TDRTPPKMKSTLLAAAALPFLVLPAAADMYQATNWMAPSHILNEFPYQEFAKDVAGASGGGMEVEVYSSGALVPAPTTMQGLADGVAQIGIVYPGYTPSELPLNNTNYYMGFVAKDDLAAAFA